MRRENVEEILYSIYIFNLILKLLQQRCSMMKFLFKNGSILFGPPALCLLKLKISQQVDGIDALDKQSKMGEDFPPHIL